MIFHIAYDSKWSEDPSAPYRGDTLETEGFIHCSRADQVLRVARERFAGQDGLVLLAIEESRLRPMLRYENTEGGEELFPHVYGALNREAVVAVEAFRDPDGDGRFSETRSLREASSPGRQPGDGQPGEK